MNSQRPTRARFGVVAFAVALAAITYLDRVCISVLAPSIMSDLSLSRIQMSFVFSAFTLAYGLFEIPTAWWADRVGTRKVLTRIVAWWSTFTIATAGAFSYPSLLIIRFLFGAGEAGAWPGVAKTFSRWIPASERGRVQGIFFMGAHLAGGVTPLLVMAMLPALGWRTVFAIFGSLGFIWAACWFRWFRDDPAQHSQVNAAELEAITRGRRIEPPHQTGWAFWKTLLTDRNVIALCLMYFANGYGFYFYITWLPTYLRTERGFSAAMLGFYSGMPLLLSVFGDLFGGIATDRATRRFGLRKGRSGIGAIAYFVAGVTMIFATFTAHPVLSAVFIAISAASCMFTLAAAWGACIDIGGDHAGVVSAAMNTAGQVGGVLSPILLAYSVERFGSWNAPLYLTGALFLLGVLCWLFIDPTESLGRRGEP